MCCYGDHERVKILKKLKVRANGPHGLGCVDHQDVRVICFEDICGLRLKSQGPCQPSRGSGTHLREHSREINGKELAVSSNRDSSPKSCLEGHRIELRVLQ